MAHVDQYRFPDGLRRRYRAFDLTIESEAAIPGLLECAPSARPDLRLRLGLPPDLPKAPAVIEAGATDRRLLRYAPDLFGVSYPDGTEFVFDRAGTAVWADWVGPYTMEDMATYLQGPILGNLLHLQGLTPLHGSCVRIDGQAAVFMGPPGAGKSTTAAALAQRGYPVVTEDVVVADPVADGFRVRPGYPHIRLWPSSAELLLGDPGALQPITPNWAKLDFPLHSTFSQQSVPLGRIYLLGPREQAGGAPRIEPLGRMEALLESMRNRYVRFPLERDKQADDFQAISRLMQAVPACRLIASQHADQVERLCDLILQDFRRSVSQLSCTA